MSEWGGLVHALEAVVTLAHGEILPGYLHLQDAVANHPGGETPLELLNRPEGFLPLTSDDGGVVFLSKEQVAMVSCTWPQEPAEVELFATSRQVTLRVVLTSGEAFEGTGPVTLPGSRQRPLDYLNSVGPFFRLETASGCRLVNRAHVRQVRPVE